ncbi:MAG: methionine--tRNA ligase [Candidatus Bathyarchaeota archaeon]|nr:methionine--tRNA ligase [Candidatus Bathyarchaeota archaeon]
MVTAAWPYIQHMLHLGNLIPILSADVIARYHRLKEDEVLFVSGSDVHGTPIDVEAVKQGTSPKEMTDRIHKMVLSVFEEWAISFDNYTTTENPVHKAFVRDFHRKIEKNGYVFTQETDLPYCPKCKRFLPDRFVEGKCPHCSYEGARGDQCEQCGRLLDPTDLLEAYCAICGTEPVFRKVTHWYFDLPKFSTQLLKYVENNKQFPDNARNFSLNFIKEGLRPRPLTRDSKWGIAAPYKGAEDKTLYGWFENVLGYVSATIEYFKKHEDEEKWREFWFDKDAKTLYFIGKDNIPFHTLILPALLLATHEDYNLPWNVSTNEFLMFKGEAFSKSRKIGVWIDEALEMFPADYWRYTLIANRPETRDTSFTWTIFLEKVNSDLNDTLGNFAHRALTFINNYFNSKVPEPKDLSELDKQALHSIKTAFEKADNALKEFQLQAAIREVLELSREGNRYLNEKKPWKTVKTDPRATANTLHVASQIVKALAVLLEPFVPFTAKKLCSSLNLPREILWEDALKPLPAGHKIKEAKPLFHKIKASERKLQEMLEKVRSASEIVSFKEFSKMDLRVGKIVKVEKIPQSKNLLKLTIDIGGNQQKTAVAGIAKYYAPEELVDRQLAVIVNLEPRQMFGIASEVMILAAQGGKNVVLLEPEKPIETGSEIS